MPEAPQASAEGANGTGRFVTVPGYVTDLSLRIAEGSGTVEAYFNFGLVTDSFSDCVTIQYPWGGVTADHAGTPGLVIAVRRNHSIQLGVFDTLTDALTAVAHAVTLPDYSPNPEAAPHETALDFFEHCVAIGVACPRYQAEATRRERESVRQALAREREAAAGGQKTRRASGRSSA
jgi:hypothetical protein